MDRTADTFARIRAFGELLGGTPEETPLDLAVATIGSVLRPSLDVPATLDALDELAAGVADRSVDGLRRHLYDGLGFTGNRTDYDHPDNSMLDLVLARRTGLPILLAIVMIEVGRRVDVPVLGIGMPMHFVVRAADDDDAYVDPFTGEALDAQGVRGRFEELAGGRLPWADRHLRPVPARHIVIRVLTNLQATYARRADRVGTALVARLRAEVPELASEGPAAIRQSAVLN